MYSTISSPHGNDTAPGGVHVCVGVCACARRVCVCVCDTNHRTVMTLHREVCVCWRCACIHWCVCVCGSRVCVRVCVCVCVCVCDTNHRTVITLQQTAATDCTILHQSATRYNTMCMYTNIYILVDCNQSPHGSFMEKRK